MSMGRRQEARQDELWIATNRIAKAPGHPFYAGLNRALAAAGFDRFAEQRCAKFYSEGVGRRGIAPGVYFRMLMIGYFEGIDSERGIAWRCADSLGLREFLGYDLTQKTPDHSSLSVIRNRIDVQTHQEIFDFVLGVLRDKGLVKGTSVGVDATTLEANAAMRSIVRRDTGEAYQEFLTHLARESGIETPTRDELAKLDRTRKKKASNDDWENPNDPDAKITKMKDGRTHLAHKAEHAVDMDTGATLAVTVQPADRGDTKSLGTTLCEAAESLAAIDLEPMRELVADRGYHSNDVVADLEEMEVRSYVSEPGRGRRRWKNRKREQRAVYANRRRIRGERGKRLLRTRGELLERPFAHCYETGAMRRTHLRGHRNILKRLLIHAGAGNLALLMRRLHQAGTPRGLAGLAALVAGVVAAARRRHRTLIAILNHLNCASPARHADTRAGRMIMPGAGSSTGC